MGLILIPAYDARHMNNKYLMTLARVHNCLCPTYCLARATLIGVLLRRAYVRTGTRLPEILALAVGTIHPENLVYRAELHDPPSFEQSGLVAPRADQFLGVGGKNEDAAAVDE